MRKVLFIWLGFCLSALFTGCADENMPVSLPDGEGEKTPVDVTFQLNLAVAGNEGTTPPAQPDSTQGNTIENRINSVQLFVVPMDDQGNEAWNELIFGETNIKGNFNNPVTVTIPEFIFNKINVYVGANMNREQTRAFIKSKTGYHEMTKDKFPTYYQSINQLAPFHAQWNEGADDRNPENIVMFATSALSADKDNIKENRTDDKKTTIDLGTATLKRVVAKVLLTCITGKGSGTGSEGIAPGSLPDKDYVKTANKSGESEDSGPQGWIRQENVYYFINSMPRRVKFLQEYEDKDHDGEKEALVPDYNLRETVNELNVKFTPLKFSHEEISEVYIHYDQLELYKRNQSFRQSEVWSQTDYDNLIADKESAYSEDGVGMYTVENVFGVNDGDFSEDELKQMKDYTALPFLTHVSIAAKFTPRFIYVTEEEWKTMQNEKLDNRPLKELTKTVHTDDNGKNRYYLLKCDNEAVSHRILTLSLQIAGHLILDENAEYDPENNPYMFPAETFFAYFVQGEVFYCSYGTASLANPEERPFEEFVPYTRGWSYYYTYINNEGTGPVTSIKQSIIERNNYYILKLNSITSLGTSASDEKYIKVHTLKSDWQEGGTGGVIIQ